MSKIQEPRNGEARSMKDTGKMREQNQRFTPLRSYVTRARVLATEPRGEPVLSRLVPVPLQT